MIALERELAVLLALALTGCGSAGQTRAFPLYPNPDLPRASKTLAQLQGPIGTVDGIDVERRGSLFHLLPGCHVVTLRRKVEQSDVSGDWVAQLGKMTYAFRMRPDHRYSVDISARLRGPERGTVTIVAEERDGAGTVVSVVQQALGESDLRACREWDGH